MPKLESLADRPANKDDVGKTVYGIQGNQGTVAISSLGTGNIVINRNDDDNIINNNWLDYHNWYWSKPAVVSESELAKLRGLVERANKLLKHAHEHYDCFDYKQEDYDEWLKEAEEVSE